MPNAPDDERGREYHVTPRYLAGSSGTGDPGFAPVVGWPHHYLADGPCHLVVVAPDQRIRIGWFGDDYLLWKIAAYPDAVSAPRWTATFNQNTPPEIVAGLTAALARDYQDGNDRFLAAASPYWAEGIQPLRDAGWIRASAERGTVEIVAPDQQAGAVIDRRRHDTDDVTWTLWAGPPGRGTRAEATFTTRTPSHLIAATAAAMADPTPVVRARHQISRDMAHLVRLTPIEPDEQAASQNPSIGDEDAGLRVRAARMRTTPASQAGSSDTPDRPGATSPAGPRSVPRLRH